MTRQPTSARVPRRAGAPRLAALAALAAVLVLAACTRGGTEPLAEPIRTEPTMQPADMVDLTVYFRSGEGSSAYLVPVTKETAITGDLPLAAVQHLIAGPRGEDESGLSAALPPETQVLDLRVADGTAHLDLSREVISRAAGVSPSDEHEALALAAIVGTLTEFPTIEQVRLSVEGHQTGSRRGLDVGAFWGGWGLPEVLVRDESIMVLVRDESIMAEPSEGDGVPPLDSFSTEDQDIGAPPDEPLAVTRVRVRDRVTYLRVIVELADVGDPDAAAAVPPARVREDGGRIVLEIDDIAAYDADVEPGQRVEVEGPAFDGVVVEDTDRPDQVRITVLPTTPREFWLRDLSSPTRLILDVRK
ncbi:MAG: GerMN domain-containing protein [Egibacteraceae bacterium]